jgi:hypothetical protein
MDRKFKLSLKEIRVVEDKIDSFDIYHFPALHMIINSSNYQQINLEDLNVHKIDNQMFSFQDSEKNEKNVEQTLSIKQKIELIKFTGIKDL